jgi:hypothetical protein
MKRIHPITWVLLLAVAAGGGCYTVLRHPDTVEFTDDSGQTKACAECHADADLYHFTDSYNEGWYEYYPAPWAAYYATPWWYQDYWYYDLPDPIDPDAPRAERGRHLWARGSTGGSAPLPVQGGKDTLAPSVPATTDTPKPEDKPSPPEKEKKKEKRHLWGR